MTSHHLYPYLLTPAYKDYIWGGTRIPERYHRDNTPTPCAESWEVSDRPEGESTIQNGPYAGESLSALITKLGPALVGRHYEAGPLPLLIKLIDAKQHLSVQVHPNDATAPRFDAEAKTEMWYVLAASPDAQIYAGLKPGTTQAAFLAAIENDSCGDLLQAVPAIPGQAIFVPGGKVHAIGAGCLLLEVQQNSNTTYRVYDWGRVGPDGQPRETHQTQALGVIDWSNVTPEVVPPSDPIDLPHGTLCDIVRAPLFTVQRLELTGPHVLERSGDRFTAIFNESGHATIAAGEGTIELPEGGTCLIPAALKQVTITPATNTRLIIMTP